MTGIKLLHIADLHIGKRLNEFNPDCLIVAHQFCREMIVSEWEMIMQKKSQSCYGKVVMQLPNLVFQEELYFAEDKMRLL